MKSVILQGLKVLEHILVFGVKAYQQVLSPLLGSNCRHQPTCSHYAIESIREWGALKGGWMALRRLSKCHPWGTHGWDPVPKKDPHAENRK